MELTSLDLSLLMDEFGELEEGHIQKVYQREKELTLEVYIHGEGKKRLVIGTDRAFLSKYKRDNPTRPPGFCMELRKHLSRVDSIHQEGFDRVLEIESGDTRLVCELFGKGNFILVKDRKVIGALRQEEWSDRKIEVGEPYQYPEPAEDPRELDDFFEAMDEGEVVRRIASDLSLGGTYAEEVCARADVDKNTEIEDLNGDERERLREKIGEVLEPEMSPRLYVDEGPERAAPFRLEKYADHEYEEFDSFSEALDNYYYRRKQRKHERKRREAYEEKKSGLEKQKEQQERKMNGLEKSAEQNRERAEKIYENYQMLQKVKDQVSKGISENGWDRAEEKIEESDTGLSEKVNSLNEQENFVSVSVDGDNLKIYLDRDLEATASYYYDRAKESESKMENVEEALEETERQLEELEEEEVDVEEVMEDKTEKRKKKWFEKYRWFYSSGGHLVLAGRDQQTNDMLVSKHMESDDLYFHADFDGAPSVVLKDGQEAGEEDRREAAKAAVTFAKTWKAGIGADDVYYVDPEQVTEEPESGEYLEKGSFVIRGDREYIRNVSVEAAVGPYEIEDGKFVPVCGPVSAVESNCEGYVELRPGNTKKSELAKQIRSRFDQDLDLDYVIRSLPPGKSEIE